MQFVFPYLDVGVAYLDTTRQHDTYEINGFGLNLHGLGSSTVNPRFLKGRVRIEGTQSI